MIQVKVLLIVAAICSALVALFLLLLEEHFAESIGIIVTKSFIILFTSLTFSITKEIIRRYEVR